MSRSPFCHVGLRVNISIGEGLDEGGINVKAKFLYRPIESLRYMTLSLFCVFDFFSHPDILKNPHTFLIMSAKFEGPNMFQ